MGVERAASVKRRPFRPLALRRLPGCRLENGSKAGAVLRTWRQHQNLLLPASSTGSPASPPWDFGCESLPSCFTFRFGSFGEDRPQPPPVQAAALPPHSKLPRGRSGLFGGSRALAHV